MADDSSSTEASTSENRSPKTPKICGVCGDRAKSNHFGAISCDSCKAFFRRSVQNDACKHFHCPYDRRCHISMTSRKCCQYCRFQKCLNIGMEKTWVMSDDERLELLRQRMKRKSTTSEEKRLDDLKKFLNPQEIQCIQHMVSLYQKCYKELPFPCLEHKNQNYTNVDIISFFTLIIRRITRFAQQFEPFSRLKPRDQNILLRSGMIELCAIRGVHAYDSSRDCWPDTNVALYKDSCCIKTADISRLVSPDTFEIHMRFTLSVQELKLDETTLMLFLVCVLFSPDRQGLECREEVEKEQEFFLLLLRKYMNWRLGVENAALLYPKLLLKLPDLRQLNEAHSYHSLRLDSEELAQVQNELENLHFEERCVLPSVLNSSLTNEWQTATKSSWVPVSAEPFRLEPTPPQSPPFDGKFESDRFG